MTEIRVERKTGMPWWAYALGVLALLALVVVVLRGCATTTAAVVDRSEGPSRVSTRSEHDHRLRVLNPQKFQQVKGQPIEVQR